MKLSLIIFCFNQQDFIIQCLESVARLDNIPDEIIVTDDCSTDSSFKLIEEFVRDYPNLPWVLNRNAENMGLIPHCNKAIGMATGDAVMVMGGDDEARRDAATYVRRNIEDPGVFGLLVNPTLIDANSTERGRLLLETPAGDYNWSFQFRSNKLGYHCAFRREAFAFFGPLVDGGVEDRQLMFREGLLGRVRYVAEPIVRYRRHDQNHSQFGRANSRDFERWRTATLTGINRGLANMEGFFADLTTATRCFAARAHEFSEVRTELLATKAAMRVRAELLANGGVSLRHVWSVTRNAPSLKKIAVAWLSLLGPRLTLSRLHGRHLSNAMTERTPEVNAFLEGGE